MTIAVGVSKLLSYKKQTALGVKAPSGAAATARYLRRVTSGLTLKKAWYSSNELRPSQQMADGRLGVKSVEGTIAGEVSVGTYQQFEESMLRGLAVTPITTGAQTTMAVASTTGASGTFTRSAGSFLTDDFKLGMVVRVSGFAAPAAGLNGVNLFIIGLVAGVMTFVRMDGATVPTKASGDSVTITEVGKHIFIPQANQNRDYYTFEHDYADVKQSEQFTDCVVTQMDVKLPGSGMATVDWSFKGLDMQTTDYSVTGSNYFLTPAPASTGAVLASSNGLLYLNGNPVALITGLNFSVKGNHTTIGGVVGSNLDPDIIPGTIGVDGQVTVLFQDATMRDLFVNETEFALYAVFTSNNLPNSDFKAYSFPRCKMTSADKDDGNKNLIQTMNFTALENPANGGAGKNQHSSTITIQDSTFV